MVIPYERPALVATPEATQRELRRLGRSLRRAVEQGDRVSAGYLERRMVRAHAVHREHSYHASWGSS